MLARTLIPQIERAYDAWDRAGREGDFRAYLGQEDPSIAEVLAEMPDLVSRLHKETALALGLIEPAKKRRLSWINIQLFWHDLIVLYQKTASPDDTFVAFIERIRSECSTQAELEEWLRRKQQ